MNTAQYCPSCNRMLWLTAEFNSHALRCWCASCNIYLDLDAAWRCGFARQASHGGIVICGNVLDYVGKDDVHVGRDKYTCGCQSKHHMNLFWQCTDAKTRTFRVMGQNPALYGREPEDYKSNALDALDAFCATMQNVDESPCEPIRNAPSAKRARSA